jgi:hypothetical protein
LGADFDGSTVRRLEPVHRFSCIGCHCFYDPPLPEGASAATEISSRPDPSKSGDTLLGLKRVSFTRLIPIFGPLISRPGQDELDNYWRDTRKQIFWQVCDQKSADDLLGGGILKELRLLRGTIGLTQILLLLSAGVLGWNVFAAATNRRNEGRWGWWPRGTFVVTLGFYVCLIIPSYLYVEYDEHLTIWAAFPRQFDKYPSEIAASHIDELLPCKKMQIIAGPRKNEPPSPN